MSFVITQPEALTFAASKLEGLGSSMAAQGAAAAAATTDVVAAAADPISALQAEVFFCLRHTVPSDRRPSPGNPRAAGEHPGQQRGCVRHNRAANAAAASSDSEFSIIDQLTQFGQFGLIPGALNNGSLIGIQQMNTFGSGASGLFSWTSLGGNGSVADGAETLGAGGLASGGLGGFSPAAGAAGPVGASGAGGAPLLAGVARDRKSVV